MLLLIIYFISQLRKTISIKKSSSINWSINYYFFYNEYFDKRNIIILNNVNIYINFSIVEAI